MIVAFKIAYVEQINKELCTKKKKEKNEKFCPIVSTGKLYYIGRKLITIMKGNLF